MAKPSVLVSAEPVESSAIVYGPLAAKSSQDDTNGQLAVLFNLTSQESANVTFNKVVTSFPGSNVPPSTAVPSPTVTVAPSATKQWYFLKTDMIFLAEPAATAVRFELSFDGFSDPVTVDMTLAPYAGASYPFPAGTADLDDTEYWYGCSGIHGGAGGGTQMFAYDLRVVGFDAANGTWEAKQTAASDATLNTSYRAWGKPICAMAAGTVVQFLDGVAANTPPNLPSPTPSPVEGNHFYIQHGDDLALYAHFQAGTMNAALLQNGAQVAAGDFLGLCGNSGNSSEPHLHLHIIRATKPWQGVGRPVMFDDINVLELGQVDPKVWPPKSSSPWSYVAERALPNVWSAIWPGRVQYVLSKRKWLYVLAWAWIIVIGGLMITPGGIECIKCGPTFQSILGLVSIVAGVAGLGWELFGRTTPRTGKVAAPLSMRNDMHGG